MKVGFTLAGRGPFAETEALSTLAKHGEDLGFDLLSRGDHIVVPRHITSRYPYTESGTFPGSSSGEYVEQLTVLSFLAGQTQRIRLVTSVLIVPHRNPLVAAKQLATLDVLSKGRLVVGVGVGWMREEFEALGLPPFAERGAVTDEYLQIFKELWTSDNPSFRGQYSQFDNLDFLPKPVQKPHPPIWVGGESQYALRRTARFANGWYPIAANPQFPLAAPQQLQAGLERLAAFAEAEGRTLADFDIVYRVHGYHLRQASGHERQPFDGTADDIASDIRQFEALGVTHLVIDFTRDQQTLDGVLSNMEAFATQVWPRVR
jgi:probable F420-dependent oxidoreductase